MKKQFFLSGAICLQFMCTLISCNDDGNHPEPIPNKANYVYSTIVGDNSYVGVIDNLENTSQLTNSNSLIHAKSALLFTRKDYLYVLEFETNEKLFQYRKVDGDLQLVKALALPAQSFPTNLTFKNDQEAYLCCGASDKVLFINTQNMTITKEIDLSSYRVDARSTASPAASIIRDDLLFVSLWQLKASFFPHNGAYMVVIDTKTNEPIHLFSIEKASMAGAGDSVGDPFIDENGDIYIYCTGSFGYTPGCKEGFLRIKKGETTFDNSYYFPIADIHISDIPGNKANYIYQKVYVGDGKIYGYINVPASASQIPDYQNDRTMQPVVIDIYNKTVEKLELDASPGWSCSIAREGDKLIWGMVSSEGAGLYVYNYKARKVEKFVKTTGFPYRILTFK